jgi:ABC-type uncharacterized transport system involved in gliding motility auxiliary subunit
MIFLKRYAVWIGAACLVTGGLIQLFGWSDLPFKWVLFVAGSFLLFIALTLNAEELRGLLDLRATRYGAGATVLALLALGVVAFGNAVSYRHSHRWDLTENRRNSLSPQTIQLLRGLKTSVNAIAFYRSDTPGKRTAEDLLNQYASYSGGKFTWRIEDTDRAVALARQYNVDSYGTVVLETGAGPEARTEKVTDAEEEKLTNALVKLTRSGKRIVYLVKGHGEREMGNTDKTGFSQAKDQMEKSNYEVKELVLARDPKVPEDASIVIVPGPKTDLFPQELSALDAYLARGGKVFFMATPFQGEGLAKYLGKYGVVLDDDVVIELNPLGQLFGTGPLVPIVNQYDSHPITRDMAGVMTLFPLTRSVDTAKAPPKGVQVDTLARTSPQSWGETDKSVFQKGTAQPDPGEKRGPLPVALVATIEPSAEVKTGAKPAGADEKKTPKARIVVVGTADFASNQFLGAQGNRDFFLNVVSWLAEEEDLISVRPKDTRQNPVVLTSAQSNVVLWVPLALLPATVLACGIVVIVQRRRSK